jgi:hypothetical protein
MLLLPAVMLASSLSAHNTLFGIAPRTIWKNGLEYEAEAHNEIFRRFVYQDSTLANPRDLRVNIYTFSTAFTYGISRDVSIRGVFPISRAVRSSKDDTEAYTGIRDFTLGLKWRLYNEPRPGGSFQGGAFWQVTLPTAQARGPTGILSDDISFGDDSFSFQTGLTWAWSTREHYFWFDMGATIHTVSDGMTPGPSIQFHPAYALRVFELTDYRDFDLILLFEGDLEFRERTWVDQERQVPSGFYKVHLSFGIQMNITNFVEIKFGYEYPVYQYYFAPTFVHDGEAKFSFNYLF